MSFSKSTNNKTLCPRVTPDSTGHAPVQVCAGVCVCVCCQTCFPAGAQAVLHLSSCG